MQITVTTLAGDLFPIDVPEDLEVGDFKALCEAETAIPFNEIELLVFIFISPFYLLDEFEAWLSKVLNIYIYLTFSAQWNPSFWREEIFEKLRGRFRWCYRGGKASKKNTIDAWSICSSVGNSPTPSSKLQSCFFNGSVCCIYVVSEKDFKLPSSFSNLIFTVEHHSS